MFTPSDTFSGIRIHAGPFNENGYDVYYYELRFIDNNGPALTKEDRERRKIKFQANVTKAYAGEKPPQFAPNEYRCLFRASLPAELYPWRPDQAESSVISASIAEECDKYLRASKKTLDFAGQVPSAMPQ